MLLQGDGILCTTSVFIEVTKSLPKYTQVLSYLLSQEENDKKPRKFSEILLNAQISAEELQKMLADKIKWFIVGEFEY